MITDYHAKYFAYDLTRRHVSNGVDRLSRSLFDASVDLNPHQIEAALFALKSPLSKGVLLADEVGLGKTIEAGIVLCQYWSERRRRLLVICPASLRKQWALELEEKFHLPTAILDAKTWRDAIKKGQSPLSQKAVVILSYNYANKIRDELKPIAWGLVVIDEAHKLRNAYRESNKMGQGLRWATEDCRKLLLTATPLQNSLLELYGLSSLIDDHLFGDVNAFRSQYGSAGGDLDGLRQRLSGFCKRTLRNQVKEYISYTERRAITRPFRPTDDEHKLYEAVSDFLLRPNSYAIPHRQKHLTELILRKLLASSSLAIAGTLETMRIRLEALRDEKIKDDPEFAEQLIADEDIEEDLLDEILEIDPPDEEDNTPATIERKQLREEIELLGKLVAWARSIGTDTKTRSLLNALEIGFQQMAKTGAQRKVLIFTESRRTQKYLVEYLMANGYAGQLVQFNGVNNSPETTAIYKNWLNANQGTGRITGSRDIDIRVAEIASITIGNVMNEAEEIKESFSLKGKGDKYRTIYLVNTKVIEALNCYLHYRREQGEDLNPNQPLFKSQKASGFNGRTLQRLFKIMYRKANLDEQLSSHSGRRSFCTNLINSGVGLKSVSVLMGHASIQTTVDIYCDHNEEILKNVCKNFKVV